MSRMLQARCIWRSMSPMLKVRVSTVYKELWGVEAAEPCSEPHPPSSE